MGLYNHALMQVAVKTIMRREDDVLVIVTPKGLIDFPGGRMDESEVELPFTEVLQREVQEELGEQVTFEIGRLLFVARRQYAIDGKRHRILAVYFESTYQRGDVLLSEEHEQYVWMKPAELQAADPSKFISAEERKRLLSYLV